MQNEQQDHETGQNTLSRKLTSAQVSMIGLAGALGTGLFLGSGTTIGFGGPGTILAYILAGSLALIVVWAMAELAATHPVPGGPGAVAAAYLGPLGGYILRWNIAVTFIIAISAEVTAAGTYLQYWFPLPLWAGTVGSSLLIMLLNFLTVRLYGTSEYWFSMFKVVAIIVFILLGASLIVTGWPGSHGPIGLGNLVNNGGFLPNGFGGVMLATCFAVFSFGGIENVSAAAAEAEHPERDVPRAAKTMIWRLLLFYVFAVAVVVTLQPWQVTGNADGTVGASPFVKAMELAGIPIAADIMNAVVLIAALSAANGCLYASSRMVHSLAIDRQAPHWAARTTANGTPRNAVLLICIGFALASVLAIVSPDRAFTYLASCATVGILVSWVSVSVTLLAFRRRRAGRDLPKPPIVLPLAPLTTSFVIVSSIAIFVTLMVLDPVVRVMGVAYIVVLFGSYLLVRRAGGTNQSRVLQLEI
ncbi:MAG: amino acid permease [Varibaculum sp.]|nr:amino acid permease [Varibaculum sp.]